MSMMLPWDWAGGIAVASCAAGIAAPRLPIRRGRAIGMFLREASVVLALYALWMLAGHLSPRGTSGALERAHWIEHVQAMWHLPSESAMQDAVLWSSIATQAANIYYDVMHFPATIALLIWLFVRHRAQYSQVRTTLVITTFACLMVQLLLPVAPPRLLPGYVDTALVHGMSVYGGGLDPAVVSAMPSVHVAWALAVGWYVWRIAPRRWGWIGPAHAAITVFVVVVTANHWWLDGVAAAALLVAGAWLAAAMGAVMPRRDHSPSAITAADPGRALAR